MMNRIYMDYNATAPLLPEAKAAMIAAMECPGNPSSVHREGQMARRIVNRGRDSVARLLGAKPAHVTFTSGATEAASHLLTPDYVMGRSSLTVSKLYLSAVEHPCVLSGGRFAKDNMVILPVDQNGLIDLDQLEAQLASHDQKAGLPMLALQAVNNETGAIQPLEAALKIAKKYKVISVVDAVQAVGRLAFDIETIGADFVFCSAHKIGGPKGVGAIISRGEILMPSALIKGGGHEKGHRAGTENLTGIAGFGAACDVVAQNLAKVGPLQQSRDELIANMRKIAPDVMIHSEAVARIANTICFSVPELKSETLQIAFDMENIAVSSGSACSSGKVGESHVLAAMYQDEAYGFDRKLGGIRVSLGVQTKISEYAHFLSAFEKINGRRQVKNGGQFSAA